MDTFFLNILENQGNTTEVKANRSSEKKKNISQEKHSPH